MPIPVVCVRPTPALPGAPDLLNNAQPLPELGVFTTPAVSLLSAPRFIADFPLGRGTVQYWLATLCRATYQTSGDAFRLAARAVVPSSYPITFVPNAAGLVPGYGLIVLPDCGVLAISGTTNLGQWLEQLFASTTSPTSFPTSGQQDNGATLATYLTAANTIHAAVAAVMPDDRPLLLTGHSMGGAVAELLHYRYRGSFGGRRPSRCLTFAAPKPGNATVAENMRTSSAVLRRLIVEGDFVPALPPDLGLLNVVVPPALAPQSSYWSSYRAPGVPYYVDVDGAQTNGAEPFLPLLMISAMVTAAAGNPLAPLDRHLMRTLTARTRAVYPDQLPEDDCPGWSNPPDIDQANAALAAVNL